MGEMTVSKLILVLIATFTAVAGSTSAQVAVRVEPMALQTSRPLPDQTRQAVIRDYLHAWRGLQTALEQNRPDLLEADFVGTAKDRLADTIHQQSNLGIRTRYQDRSHDLQILFYSPDGMSIELMDKVEYDVQLIDRDKVIATQRESASYLVVLAPAEVRWRVRIFQSTPQ
jgi:hypothetical protein